MIKKIFPLLLAGIIIAPSLAMGGYERAVKIVAKDVVDHQNNFILFEDNGEQWLIHHQTGCKDVEEGDNLTLVISGELDGNQDVLWNGDYSNCIVDQAELITGKLHVTTVSNSDTSTSVSDDGTPYLIFYSERCKAMKGLNGWDVYVRKYSYDKTLREGDKFFLPGAGEFCTITHVTPEGIAPPQPEPVVGDIKRPTTPTHFRAIPTTSAVYLYWDESFDNAGIDHYEISASLYHVDDEVARDPSAHPQEMPGVFPTETNKPSYRLDFLDPDELYFFRIIAVDTSGNKSSYWSEEATAFTKSSIAERSVETSPLRLYQAQETDYSFLFRWNSIAGAKYSVVLEVDGERVFTSNDWRQQYVRILKKAERKGKKMELTVRSLDYRGNILQDSRTFSF